MARAMVVGVMPADWDDPGAFVSTKPFGIAGVDTMVNKCGVGGRTMMPTRGALGRGDRAVLYGAARLSL